MAEANQKCTGHPLMYNGKKCASTTRYADYHKGACGCGPVDNDNQVERVVNSHCLIFGITTLNWHNVLERNWVSAIGMDTGSTHNPKKLGFS